VYGRNILALYLPYSLSTPIINAVSFVLNAVSFVLNAASFVLNAASFVLNAASFVLNAASFVLFRCNSRSSDRQISTFLALE
jgi:hypothetical protein